MGAWSVSSGGDMILIIDNFDSFTFNLVQCLGAIGQNDRALRHEIRVIRNDKMTADAMTKLGATHLIVSPGPGTPDDSGESRDALRKFMGHVPILGVCLGHQCIADVFGARVQRAERVMHGKTSEIHHDGRTIFSGLPNPFVAMRYHSLIVDRETLDPAFEISAWTESGECMAIRQSQARIEGVQFHPESFLTTAGTQLLRNFLTESAP